MTGKIFNIERYHYTDGSGIRILVFLKGCSLRCPWCSNPESQNVLPQLAFVQNRCVNCGRCVPVCETQAIYFDSDGKIGLDRQKCTNCGRCVEWCFHDARTLFGKEITSSDLMKEILKERDYFIRSHGGVTFSGGEPTLQAEFVRECSLKCRQEYINTAIETSGAVPWEKLKMATEHIDEILYDIKILDEETFRTFSEYSVSHILDNLRKLREMDKKVRIRCPIIPGYNMKESFIKEVIQIAKAYKIGQIDVLPFHQFGSYKYRALGMEYVLKDKKSLQKNQIENFREMIRSEGIYCIIGG